jgi:hypothetical protein
MENDPRLPRDPRDKLVKYKLLGRVGYVQIKAGEVKSVVRNHYPTCLYITTSAGNFQAEEGHSLYPDTLRMIAECAEYQAAADEVAAQTEARIQ